MSKQGLANSSRQTANTPTTTSASGGSGKPPKTPTTATPASGGSGPAPGGRSGPAPGGGGVGPTPTATSYPIGNGYVLMRRGAMHHFQQEKVCIGREIIRKIERTISPEEQLMRDLADEIFLRNPHLTKFLWATAAKLDPSGKPTSHSTPVCNIQINNGAILPRTGFKVVSVSEYGIGTRKGYVVARKKRKYVKHWADEDFYQKHGVRPRRGLPPCF